MPALWTPACVPRGEAALAVCQMPASGIADGPNDSAQHEDAVDALVLGRVSDAVVILDVFKKQTPATAKAVIAGCRRRLAE